MRANAIHHMELSIDVVDGKNSSHSCHLPRLPHGNLTAFDQLYQFTHAKYLPSSAQFRNAQSAFHRVSPILRSRNVVSVVSLSFVDL